MRSRVLSLLVVAGFVLAAGPAGSQTFFSHDVPGIGLPGTAVNVAPEPADIFMAPMPMCTPSYLQGPNMLFFDNILSLGLMAGDNIDAYSILHPMIPQGWPFWRFSVDLGTVGVPASAVNLQLPTNTADIFWTNMSGMNWLCLFDWQLGLALPDDVDGLEDMPPAPMVYFSLAPGSPSLALLGATPGDILGVIPNSGMLPAIVIPFAAIGLMPTDNLDGLTLTTDPTGMPAWVYFSVTQGALGVPGSGVNASTPLNGADLFFSMSNGTNMPIFPAPALGLLQTDEVDGLDPDQQGAIPPLPKTIAADLNCVPAQGTVPFVATFNAQLSNLYPYQYRRIAARIAVTLANGNYYPNWRSGYTTLPGGTSFTRTWTQFIPALGSLIGTNTFQLNARDVTPAPFNQPPYPASGDTDTGNCAIVANAP